ncbi:MAG: tetratricopeptide repeat protein [Dissulfurispiraceae bacterium]|jgi:tetratricopeptide (TPR) repeat protein|nr:tetratricopeptide repeat protein [Dissulfurispiraceae bacterium]
MTFIRILILVILGMFFSVFLYAELPVSDHLKQADQFYKLEQYLEAKAAYSDIYRYFNKDAEGEAALLGIARSDFRLNLYNEAVIRLNIFIASFPESTHKNEALYLLAESLRKLGRFEDAKKNFEMVRDPLLNVSLLRLAQINLKQNDMQKAEEMFKLLPYEFRTKEPEAVLIEAEIQSRSGKHKEALALVRKIKDSEIKNNELLIDKASVLFAAGQLTESEDILKPISESSISAVDRNNSRKLLLKIYEAQGKIDDALKISIELSAGQSSDQLKLKIISFYEKKGDVQNALRYLTYIVDKKLRGSEIERRLKSFEEKHDPKLMDYLVRYSLYLSEDSPYLVETAKKLAENNKKAEALTLYRKALTGSNKAYAAIMLSSVLLQEGKTAQAKRMLEPFLLDTRYLESSSVIMADILEREGELKKAAEYLLKVIKVVKNNNNIHAKLGDIYWKLENRRASLQSYVRAATGSNPLYSVKAADALYLGGDLKKASVYYKKALDAGINDKNILQWAEYQYGKITGNKDYLKKAEQKGGLLGEAAAILAE